MCNGYSQKQKKLLQRNNKSIKQKANSLTMPLKPKASISLMSPERIKVAIQSYWIENKMLKSKRQNLQQEISKSYMKVDDGLSTDLIKIMSNVEKSSVPFHEILLEGITKILKCFLQNINPLPSNANLILLSFTSKIYCCIQWNTLWWKNWDWLCCITKSKKTSRL